MLKMRNMWNHRVLYQKSQKLLSSWARCMPHTKGYITHNLKLNGYWVLNSLPIVCGVQWAVSVILNKELFVTLLHFPPFWYTKLFLDIPNEYFSSSVIYLVDFSERYSTEMISFFWRSVYFIYDYCTKLGTKVTRIRPLHTHTYIYSMISQ